MNWNLKVCVAVALLLWANVRGAQLSPGDIIVVDSGSNKLLLVDPASGRRKVLSDFQNISQGPTDPGGLTSAVATKDGIFVSSLFGGNPQSGGAVYFVEPSTGQRTIISNFGQGSIQGNLYYGMTVLRNGYIAVNAQNGASGSGIVQLRQRTDRRTFIAELSAFSVLYQTNSLTINDIGGSGPLFASLSLFPDPKSSSNVGAIAKVDRQSGLVKSLTDFRRVDQGVETFNFSLLGIMGLAVEKSGDVLVHAQGDNSAALIRVDRRSGNRHVITNYSDSNQGEIAFNPVGLALDGDGDAIAALNNVGANSPPAIFKIDRNNGRRSVLSDSLNPMQGPPFTLITYLTIVNHEWGVRVKPTLPEDNDE